jgi:Ca2+-binding RTX toxin-like protein
LNISYTIVLTAGSTSELTITNWGDGTDKFTFASGSAFTSTAILDITMSNSSEKSLNLSSVLGTGGATASVTGGTADDTIVSGADIDIISGGNGADNITGGAGADSLVGGAGNDTIAGGAGADNITGGTGVDAITGGDGIDNYIYTATGETAAAPSTWTAATGGSTISVASADIITVTDADGDTVTLTGLNTGTVTPVTTTITNAASTTAAANTVLTWLGNYSAGTFTSSATGSDTLVVFDDGTADSMIVLVGAASVLTI